MVGSSGRNVEGGYAYAAWGERINVYVERVPASDGGDSDDGAGATGGSVLRSAVLEEGKEGSKHEGEETDSTRSYHPDSDAGLDPSELYPEGGSDAEGGGETVRKTSTTTQNRGGSTQTWATTQAGSTPARIANRSTTQRTRIKRPT